MNLKNLVKLSSETLSNNINLKKLLGGSAAAGSAAKPVEEDCNSLKKIFSLKNTGGPSDKSDRQNQCMWISIFDFLEIRKREKHFSNVVQVAGLGRFKSDMFDLENEKYNEGEQPRWGCSYCKSEQQMKLSDDPFVQPMKKKIVNTTVVCAMCNNSGTLSYPLQRLANHYNIRIQIYNVHDNGELEYIEPQFKIHPVTDPDKAKDTITAHIAQYRLHFELIVCGLGIREKFDWKERNAAIEAARKKQIEDDYRLARAVAAGLVHEEPISAATPKPTPKPTPTPAPASMTKEQIREADAIKAEEKAREELKRRTKERMRREAEARAAEEREAEAIAEEAKAIADLERITKERKLREAEARQAEARQAREEALARQARQAREEAQSRAVAIQLADDEAIARALADSSKYLKN